MQPARLLPCLAALAWACACSGGPTPSSPDASQRDASPPDAPRPPDPEFPAVVRGVVWAPGNAPGMVPPEHEIPVSGAYVYYAALRPGDITSGAHCELCEDEGAVRTDAKGNFEIAVPPGTYWLTLKKGLFRLDQQITVTSNQTLELPAAMTTLPSRHDPANGKYIPRIALAEGLWDNVEDILGKMGLGAVDGSGNFVCGTEAGIYDLYINGSGAHGACAIGDLYDLVTNLVLMKTYHIIFIPCSNGDHERLFNEPAIRENLREYVRAGGKLYVTDWSAEWMDVVWPAFVQFAGDYDTPATATMSSQFGDGNGSGNSEATAKAMDGRLAEWLDGQVGPLATGFPGAIDSDAFLVDGLYDQIADNPLVFAMDDMGNDIVLQAYPWVQGDWGESDGPIHPFTVTFEPVGCGRVLYSTYHTADDAHVGLRPQERVLLYLIMELGVCKSGPIVE